MGKSKKTDREYSKEQKLIKENNKLKIELARLRKQLARLDLAKYENIKEAVEEHNNNNGGPSTQDLLEALKREWACKKCESGYLEIYLFNKISETWYYRHCNMCSNRTQSKKYNSKTVKGLMKESK